MEVESQSTPDSAKSVNNIKIPPEDFPDTTDADSETTDSALYSNNEEGKANRKRLLKNTIFLYVLVFSGYFFSFITVPYQTRILGAELYGKIGWAMAVMAYFSVFIEFGFLLSATASIAGNRENKTYIEKVVGAVTLNKLFLTALSFAVLAPMAFFWSKMSSDPWFYLLCFLSVSSASFMLDFFYRGIEEMQTITITSVSLRALFTVGIFIFMHKPEDYWMVPALNLGGNLLAVMYVYGHMIFSLGYKVRWPGLSFAWQILKESLWFFLSRIASTLYTATNTFLLGFIYPVASAPIGMYTGADKLLGVMKQTMGPISDSLYPYMVRNKDFKLLKKTLLTLMPIVGLGCIVVAIIAEPLCAWFFGAEFNDAGKILRLMMLILFITLPVYLLGFPTLSPLGGSKAVNQSVIVASIFHIIALFSAFMLGVLNIYSVVLLTFCTEMIILIYRALAVRTYWKRYKSSQS